MKLDTSRMSRAAFAAAVMVALGFGAAEAFAAPSEVTRAGRSCDPVACDGSCRDIRAEAGVCHNGTCFCIF